MKKLARKASGEDAFGRFLLAQGEQDSGCPDSSWPSKQRQTEGLGGTLVLAKEFGAVFRLLLMLFCHKKTSRACARPLALARLRAM